MIVRDFNFFPYNLELKKPFVNSKFTIHKRKGFIVRIIDDNGYMVYGDVAPLPGFSYETYDKCEIELQRLYYSFLDKAANKTEFNLINEMSAFVDVPSLRFGFEQAILSLLIKQKEVKNLLPGKKEIKINGIISLRDEKETLKSLDELLSKNFSTIKVKVTGEKFSEQLKLINKITDRIDSSVKIRLDPNGSWNYEETEIAVMSMDKEKIELIEQPVDNINEIVMLSDFSPIPIAVDEAIKTINDAADLIKRSNINTFVLKPALLGGIIGIINLIKSAAKLGKKIIISSAFESVIGRSALSLLAALTEGDYAHGLNTAELFKTDLASEPYRIKNGKIYFDHFFYPPEFKDIKL
jgi:O-succinylbenzoate synthase